MSPGTPFNLRGLVEGARALADHGVLLGTSSWKYPGWCGTLYDEQRYLTRGKFSEARFERDCLAEYAACLPTVGVDASYYTLPDAQRTARMFETALAVNPAFQFAFKVTDLITVRRFPKLPRHGSQAGNENPHFLDANLFINAFLKPLEPWQNHTGPLMFEFSAFHRSDFERGRDFIAALDAFLGQLPGGWNYAVELRNPSLLRPEYLEVLQRHGVAHVHTSWQKMPPLAEQLHLTSATPQPFGCARLLLKPGRDYKQAVADFSPYQDIKEPQENVRQAAGDWIRRLLNAPPPAASNAPRSRRRGYIYVNNRLEGNAPRTLAALIQRSASEAVPP